MNAKTIVSGAAILFVGNLLSSLLGLGREVLSAAYYGANVDMDSYLFANTIPSVLLALIGGVFTAGFIPLFIKRRVEHTPESASLMYSNTMNWLIVTVLLLTAVCYLFSDALASLFATAQSSPEQIQRLLWILLPSILFFGVSFAQSAVLNSLNHFTTTAFLTVLNNAVVIAFIVLFHREMGILSVAYGYVLGTVLQVAVQQPAMRKLGVRYRWHWSLKEDYLRKLVIMSLPIIALGLIDQCILLATRFFASYLDAGSASALNYANRIVLLPVTLFGTALVSAMYPSVVRLQAERKTAEYNAVVATCIKSLLLILIPIMLICVAFAPEIIRILLQRGAFDETAARMTAFSFMILSVGVLTMPMRDFFTKLFYTKENMKAPTVSSLFFLAIFVAGCAVLVPPLGYLGIATATAIAMASTLTFIVILLKRANPDFKPGISIGYVAKIVVSSAISALLAYLAFSWCQSIPELRPFRGVTAVLAIGLALALYFAIVKALRIPEINVVSDKLSAKLKPGRGKGSPALEGVRDA